MSEGVSVAFGSRFGVWAAARRPARTACAGVRRTLVRRIGAI
ncbi:MULTISPECIES: hypothetical protein [unclassified Streptomyces]